MQLRDNRDNEVECDSVSSFGIKDFNFFEENNEALCVETELYYTIPSSRSHRIDAWCKYILKILYSTQQTFFLNLLISKFADIDCLLLYHYRNHQMPLSTRNGARKYMLGDNVVFYVSLCIGKFMLLCCSALCASFIHVCRLHEWLLKPYS